MKSFLLILLSIFILPKYSGAQWQSVPGPYLSSEYIGMHMDDITVGENGLIYAIIDNGLFISDNNGTSWMSANQGINSYSVTCVAYSDSIIFTGTYGNGIYLTRNNGSSYIDINDGLPVNSSVKSIFIEDSLILIYIGSYLPTDGIYRSTNNGETWIKTVGIDYQNTRCFTSNETAIYAGTQYGVYISTDNGLNWSLTGLQQGMIYSISADENTIFAGESNSSGRLFRSTDNGVNWTTINDSSGLTTSYFEKIIQKDNYVYIAAKWHNLFMSNDNGATWVHKDLNSTRINSVAVYDNNVYASSYDGFSISTNHGNSWHKNMNTYNIEIRSLVSSGNNLIAATDYLTHISDDKGLTWEYFQFERNILQSMDSVVYAGGNSGLLRSYNYGNSWSSLDINGLPDSPMITSLTMNDSIIILGTLENGIYFSNDDGNNWQQRSNGLSGLEINSLNLLDSVVFAATNNHGIYKSYNSALSWVPANNGLNDTCVLTLASYRNNIYAGTRNNGIFKSTDTGDNWTQVYNDSCDAGVSYLYTCGVNIFSGISEEGFCFSPDNGTTWSYHNTGLLNYNINTIIDYEESIYIGTDEGIMKRALSEIPLTFSFKEINTTKNKICQGSSATIWANVVGGEPPYYYLWSNGEQTSSITVSPTVTTTYSITVTDSNSDEITDEIMVTVYPIPETPVIVQSGDLLVSSSDYGNKWLFNSEYEIYSDSSFLIPLSDGYYSAVVERNGCVSDTSNVIYVGNANLLNEHSVIIYPNPTYGSITIELPYNIEDCELTIYDITGKEVIRQQITYYYTKIKINYLSKGVYYVKLKDDKSEVVKKIIKL